MLVKLDFIKESWMAKDQGETFKTRVEIFFKSRRRKKKWVLEGQWRKMLHIIN